MNERRNKDDSVTERLPTRFRLTDAAGKEYAPFRLKPGVALHEMLKDAGPDLDVQVVVS